MKKVMLTFVVIVGLTTPLLADDTNVLSDANSRLVMPSA